RQAEPQMHPPVPGREAVRAALRSGRHRADILDVRTGLRAHGGPPLAGIGTSYISFRYSCTNWTAIAPSPTAEATRLTESERTSPAANTPGRRVSKTHRLPREG